MGPSRAIAPQLAPAAPRHRSLVDEARLLSAIQALDEVGGSRRHTHSGAVSTAQVGRVFAAWAYFLDLSSHLEQQEPDNTARQELALVVESRVLSCVVRFLTGRSRRRDAQLDEEQALEQPVWCKWTCPHGSSQPCVANVIRTAACCFLYQLSRDAASSMLVMRSGLHAFLLNECRTQLAAAESPTDPQEATDPCWDAQDLTIAVDAFDWSTRALWTALKREGAHGEAFVVPMGARTLAYLLRDQCIPANEVDEYGILYREHDTAFTSSRSPMKRSLQSPKPRRLPSIFRFPTRTSDTDTDSADVCRVCTPRYDTKAWAISKHNLTWIHFAVRALVALALHVPSTAPEGKKFVRDGGVHVLRLLAAYRLPTSVSQESSAEDADQRDIVNATDSETQVIRAMADAGLRRFPSAQSPVESITRAKFKSPSKGSSLGNQLQALSEHTRRAAVEQRRAEIEAQRQRDRAALRERVREAFHKAMETRSHLLDSLDILSSGRMHPAAHDQTIVDWLGSFVTIEKKEQLRQEQEAMRQRRLLEAQFQVEERRRRERDERATMELHDHDTPDTFAAERAEAKREAFARLQLEMRAMQAQEEAAQRESSEETALARKREAAQEEARRLQLLADERRRQAREGALMAKEDHYYAEKILREKRVREEHARKAKLVDPIAEQQKKIERMRWLDEERKRSDAELEWMRSEDLLARQRRFIEVENLKKETDRERKARKQMEAEERYLRQCWKRIDDAAAKLRLDEDKQRRADERRAKREQEQQWKQWQAAWVTCYDYAGNAYYYNQLSGETRWDNPFAYWMGDAATTNEGATWPGTS